MKVPMSTDERSAEIVVFLDGSGCPAMSTGSSEAEINEALDHAARGDGYLIEGGMIRTTQDQYDDWLRRRNTGGPATWTG